MARQRQIPRDLRSLWKRAGERAGDGAGALFARLDAQDAQDSRNAQDTREAAPAMRDTQERERAAAALDRLAARVRAGAWSAEIASLAARAAQLSGE
jgi:hypothetical protein